MRVLAIENMKNTDHGLVGVALAERRATVETLRPYAGDALPDGVAAYDALVVFGGEQNARADDTHAYLPRLASLMREFGDAGKAVLGICLGSQVLARAHGAENVIGGAPEFGWHRIRMTEPGRADPVIAAATQFGSFTSFQWHDDTFTLPDRAVHLAFGDAVHHQAFRIGRASYGMQFHFEASTAVVESWNALFPDAIRAKQADWFQHYERHAEAHGTAADAAGLSIARAWMDRITE